MSTAQSLAQDRAGAELRAKFHADLRGADLTNPMLRKVGDAVRWDAGGARITLDAGHKEAVNPGVATNFKIDGDFEITASYEIFQVDQPTEGYGVGVSLYVAMERDPDGLNYAVSLSRQVTKDGVVRFASNRLIRGEGKRIDFVRTAPSKELAGRLRIQRVGSKMRCYVADGAKAEFVPIVQFPKETDEQKRIEVEFGTRTIRSFLFGGNAGNSATRLDLRLLEFTVRAEELPGLVEIVAPPAGQAPATAIPRGNGWLMACLLVGLGVVLLLAVASAAAVFLLRRRASVGEPEKSPDRADVIVVCSACGKKLKVKMATAGKKVKCSHCGEIVLVSQTSASQSDQPG